MSEIKFLNLVLDEAIHGSFFRLKDEASREIIQYELSLLYRHKIYNEDAERIQKRVSALAESIDCVLNECLNDCLRNVEKALEKGNYD